MNKIENSLRLVFNEMKEREDKSEKQKVEDDIDSLKVDNKWLIHKFEIILEEN